MDWRAPNVWSFVLLALATFRIWRLIGEDTILDRPRAALTRRMPKGEEFIRCPWCAGFWISVVIWLLWVWQPHWTLVGCTPLAISAIVGLIAANIDPVD